MLDKLCCVVEHGAHPFIAQIFKLFTAQAEAAAKRRLLQRGEHLVQFHLIFTLLIDGKLYIEREFARLRIKPEADTRGEIEQAQQDEGNICPAHALQRYNAKHKESQEEHPHEISSSASRHTTPATTRALSTLSLKKTLVRRRIHALLDPNRQEGTVNVFCTTDS